MMLAPVSPSLLRALHLLASALLFNLGLFLGLYLGAQVGQAVVHALGLALVALGL
ncbi:MAG: hypothetical protein ACYC4L_18220 [Chloroflexota bacterium]